MMKSYQDINIVVKIIVIIIMKITCPFLTKYPFMKMIFQITMFLHKVCQT